MKRALCLCVLLAVLLTACAQPTQPPVTAPGEDGPYGVYELDFSVECLSGWSFGVWRFVYSHNGEKIKSGHQVLQSEEIFSFYPVRVDVIRWGHPKCSVTATIQVAICEGGSGKTEVTVTTCNGKTSTFQLRCDVSRVELL